MSISRDDKKWRLSDDAVDFMVLGVFVLMSMLTLFLLPLFISMGELVLVFGFFPWYWFWGLTWLGIWIIFLLAIYCIKRKIAGN